MTSDSVTSPFAFPSETWRSSVDVGQESYSDREVEEILRRALQSHEGLDHEVLREAAGEVGIDPARLDKAAESVRLERAVEEKLAINKRRRQRGVIRHLTTWGVVSTFLLALDLLTPGGPWWYFPALSWAVFLALHALSVAFHDEERERAKLMRREARRAAAEARKIERRRKASKKGRSAASDAELAFEEAVERGLASLLNGVAGSIDRALDKAQRELDPAARGEFGQYVDRKRGRAPASQRAAGPQVRVDAARADAQPEEIEVSAEGERRERSR